MRFTGGWSLEFVGLVGLVGVGLVGLVGFDYIVGLE